MASNKNNDILTTGNGLVNNLKCHNTFCLVPKMKDLISIVIPRIAARWDTVAHYMEFQIYEINIIKKKCNSDPEECCKELFERWREQQNKYDRSWKMLLDILKQIKHLAAVTDMIEREVSQLHL